MNKIFYTFVLSALVLLSVQCNPKSQESDEQLENDSIIEYAELLSITCHDDYTDVKISIIIGGKIQHPLSIQNNFPSIVNQCRERTVVFLFFENKQFLVDRV